MNFFEAQAEARRNTTWLVLLFILAVAGLVAAAVIVVLLALGLRHARFGGDAPEAGLGLMAPVTLGVLLLVCLGSLYKMGQLRAGGRAVAEALDGTLVPRGSQEPLHRRVLNVVEEMALAAGLPVPAVYLLDEPGINAFAAGWTPQDAVIGVTRGAAEALSREELQGVVAHEFSHIAGGDMARNLRLTGALHGILLLGLAGYYLSHASRFNRKGASLAAAGLGLMAVGYIGTFFGNLIKAVISRQREFLADASAVQFTRNPQGIAGALKKIGGAGSRLSCPAASEFSHVFFANGLKASFTSLLATHPPLEERVRRLDPQWDGRWLRAAPAAAASTPPTEAPFPATSAPPRPLRVLAALGVLEQGGLLDANNLGYARGLLGRLPDELAGESCDPHGAQVLMLALVLGADTPLRARQLALLQAGPLAGAAGRVEQVVPRVAELARELRLPLIDLAMASLRGLSRRQYQTFRTALLELMQADGVIDLREWIVQRVLLRQLDGAHGLSRPPGARRGELPQEREAARLLMATLAWLEHEDDAQAEQAFAAGCRGAGLAGLEIPSRRDPEAAALDAALDRLAVLGRPARIALMRGLLACVALDDRLTVEGLEMLRALAGSLDLPMPNFVAVED